MENKEFKTSDLHFAAYLLSLDFPLKKTEIEDEGKKKVLFVFELSKSELKYLKNDYFGGNGTVKVQKFVQSLRSLKSVCHVN